MSSLDNGGNDDPICAAIDAAEEVRDPLEGLVERTAADAGSAFAPDVLSRLATLKREDRAAFEALRAQLKKAGCRVTALDEAIAEENGEVGGRGPTQADILIDLAQSAELFHAPDGTGFADLAINGHRETWPIRSRGFRRWLARRFFQQTGGAPSSEALQSALSVIEARAHFDAPERTVHVRVGGLDGRLYLDLGDETWRAVEIDASGWRVIDNPPVRFRRAAGMQALPAPVAGGSAEALRSFLNVRSDADFVLVVAWALAVLRNRGPYPVLVLSGEQGSAKSTFSAILRALLDPNTAPLRALPREDRDLFIAATNSHVLAFDNVSGLPAWISDTLCRLATGGGFAVRQLCTDQDEVLFDAVRPVILNGIEDIVTRPDLADRALFLTIEPISEERRRPEQELWAAFEAERPRILGVLLDAAAKGLAMLPHTRLDKLPRMADFALWATACETSLWPAGTFWSAYCGNRDEAVEGVIEADPIASAVRALLARRTEWTGTASDLLGALEQMAGERVAKAKSWPDSPRALAGRLRRAATFLRKVGIEIGFGREGRARTRVIRITAGELPPLETGAVRPSASSAPSANRTNLIPANGFASRGLRTVGADVDGSRRGDGPIVRDNPVKSNGETDADGTDANHPPHSGRGNESSPGWSGLEDAIVNAILAIAEARAAGVQVAIDGDPLTLEASAPPPPALVESLSRHKAEIIALLRPADDGWSALDWLTFFGERTRMAAAHGLTGIEAEAHAFDCCVVEWLNRNPVRSPSSRCLGCGETEHSHGPLLPFGTETSGHVWLHSPCWPAWHAARKAEAIAALAMMGIHGPDTR
ncbi:MAG TPA: hypothetical protein VNK48_05510 [Xanthobacteraceae bacterium]|nr:hypothetical protein [Xanthobacteraceae bacterium]